MLEKRKERKPLEINLFTPPRCDRIPWYSNMEIPIKAGGKGVSAFCDLL